MKSKEILASAIKHQDKQMLARLLKEYIDEYKTRSLKEIIQCLGNEKRGVHQ